MISIGTMDPEIGQYLHPNLQRWISVQGWADLRPIQKLSTPAILHTAEDWIINAPTASGKTEAAFLPILSTLLESPQPGLRALCICPTKTLVDDLHKRLTPIASAAEIDIHRLHGDVPTEEKRRLQVTPSGLLITTPESLEVLLIRSQAHLIFQNLRFTVIDELHALSGNERGMQTISLLHRIETLTNQTIPRIGLSATLTNPIIRPGQTPRILTVETSKPCETEWWTMPEENIPQALRQTFHQSKTIVFANSRGMAENLSDHLTQLAKADGNPEFHFVHHSSISAASRRKKEELLRTPDQPAMAICARTLELGIDIGDINAVIQIGPSPSVSALRQRLGRSGRRNTSSRLIQIQLPDFLPQRDDPVRPIRPDLLQSLATISLAEEGWCEPTENPAPHLSTLVQQLLCILASADQGCAQSQVFHLLCLTGPFRQVHEYQFNQIIQNLENHEILNNRAEILKSNPIGFARLQKEGLIAAFRARLTLRALSSGEHIGEITLDDKLQTGERLNLGGQRWEIKSLDLKNQTVELIPGPERRKAHFASGGTPIHSQIHQRMRDILEKTTTPTYLDDQARQALTEARAAYLRAELDHKSLYFQTNAGWIFHWLGDRVSQTLIALLEKQGIASFADGPAVRHFAERQPLFDALHKISQLDSNHPTNLLHEGIPIAKFDHLIPEPLLRWEQERHKFDIPAAIRAAKDALTDSR